jgi:hypothetical protein
LASSQVGIALGLFVAACRVRWRHGRGFTLPSALALVAFGLLLAQWGEAGGGNRSTISRIATVPNARPRAAADQAGTKATTEAYRP